MDDPSLTKLFPTSFEALESLPPKIRGNVYLLNNEIREFTDSTEPIASVVCTQDGKEFSFSSFARCNKAIAIEALDSAYSAYDKGRGEWPRMSMTSRAKKMSAFLEDFKKLKDTMVALLMWDICKSRKDAADEVDRTVGKFGGQFFYIEDK
ncbi:hypothetical protein EW026_g7969 [Hermanssonia centrifuga]|uniref:Aldehyde dehydrogenase domain-containing protein n=1 Tax=Hermanssonia centrifuga TaxID=98765 RepID=A0A4S4K631_9APHY|nr:hypothetical protein EW026_g7969 [Hermanssonia centrifuga]